MLALALTVGCRSVSLAQHQASPSPAAVLPGTSNQQFYLDAEAAMAAVSSYQLHGDFKFTTGDRHVDLVVSNRDRRAHATGQDAGQPVEVVQADGSYYIKGSAWIARFLGRSVGSDRWVRVAEPGEAASMIEPVDLNSALAANASGAKRGVDVYGGRPVIKMGYSNGYDLFAAGSPHYWLVHTGVGDSTSAEVVSFRVEWDRFGDSVTIQAPTDYLIL